MSGAAFPKSLQQEIKSRGVEAYQAFGTADLGLIAFETEAREGMVVNEDLILEIMRPGTGDPVAEGDREQTVEIPIRAFRLCGRLCHRVLFVAAPDGFPVRGR